MSTSDAIGVAAGALAEGGLEVYRESKTGEYDWRKILIKTLGGSLKGALASSPLKPLVTGVAVGATGAIEDYIYCLTCGETHEQALKSAAINGPIEGVTTGGLKFIGNAVANRVKAKKLPRTNPKPIADGVSAGTKRPLKINIQFFAQKKVNSGEIILPRVKTYEQARNKALEYIGDDLVKDSEPLFGRLKSSHGFNKIIGRRTADKKLRWRLDFDPEKGPHIQVDDFRKGKGNMSTKIVIPFEGNEQDFIILLRHLNK